MDKIIALAIGALCGVGQFLIMRHTLKPLEKGEKARLGRMALLRLPLPAALLVGCALVDIVLLAYTGGAFCLGLFLASVINYVVTLKERR